MIFDQLRRRDQIERDREWDSYAEALRGWIGLETTQELPPGSATCVDCGRRDLLSVSTPDGRRVILEASGEGELEIVEGVARAKVGGELAYHNCRRTS